MEDNQIEELVESIFESYINGQFNQLREQVTELRSVVLTVNKSIIENGEHLGYSDETIKKVLSYV